MIYFDLTGVVDTSQGRAHLDVGPSAVHQGRPLHRLSPATHGRVDAAVAFSPAARFGTVRVSDRHTADQELLRQPPSCR